MGAMGAKYAPRLANLFMVKWEEDAIYTHYWPELALWDRFIDDILLLWNGSFESLQLFMESLKINDWGIVLNYEASLNEINFLDLKISLKEVCFITSTYFKSTDRNSFIPLDSCHHHSLLKSVPCSQFIHLRYNCTKVEEFMG